MKIYEIREMTTEELQSRIIEEKENLVDLNFQLHIKSLTNTAKIKNTKKDIARMLTILKERESNEVKAKETK